MAGKMTILDRLMQSGKLKPGVARDLRVRGEFFDPLQYTTQQRILMEGAPERAYMAVPDNGVGREIKITPERQVYQQGLKNQFWKRENQLRQEQDEAMDRVDDLQQSYERDFEDARDRLGGDVSDEIRGWNPEEISPYDVNGYESPNYSLEDYWEGEYPLSEYNDLMAEADDKFNEAAGRLIDWQNSGMLDLQLRSPRYRNYQRAMQQREANKRMGHQLSRMWGDAYNRLRARGLSDAEARMYIRERFGGR